MSSQRLILMGSGESAPTMMAVHRRILEDAPGPACMLDTPFGFQTNADDLVTKIQTYFSESVGRSVELATWRSREAPLLERERTLAMLHSARWVFAGPGSPSYTLRNWLRTPIADALPDVIRRGGTVCLGSAAAVVSGEWAMPVYEIYKAGMEPAWLEGLDLLGDLVGMRAAVIPHYNNNEGGHYDTRFCYIGEPRLLDLESQLPPGAGILGIDEHTAVIFDLAEGTVEVVGSGVMTVRVAGTSQSFEHGSLMPIAQIAAMMSGDAAVVQSIPAASRDGADADPADTAVVSLRQVADSAMREFTSSLDDRRVDDAVAAILGLDQAMVEWASDMQQGDADYARRLQRTMIVRLGEIAVNGAADPRDAIAPYVTALLELRANARTAKDFATSDLIRDRLAEAGLDVRDTPEGVAWSLR